MTHETGLNRENEPCNTHNEVKYAPALLCTTGQTAEPQSSSERPPLALENRVESSCDAQSLKEGERALVAFHCATIISPGPNVLPGEGYIHVTARSPRVFPEKRTTVRM
jgi:hypothetical protein